ncbi:MAG: tetratricopeptide repeat protein [Planctomycetota bacterium]|jgi:tetratricopeptide (TPR) repeat protein
MVFGVWADMQSDSNIKLKRQRGLLVVSVYLALVLSTALVFWQVRDFDFVNYDDNEYVYQNQHVLNGLTYDGVIWAFTNCDIGYWQPLTWLSLMFDCQLFGPNPGRIHLVSVLLHVANTLLLFAVLRKMTGSLWPSAFVAAAFALHPMHVESVAWIAERKDVLSTFFLLLTMLAYTGYTKGASVYRYMAGLAAFALGLMAKPMLVTLPFLLLLLDYWPLNRFGVREPLKISGKSTDAAHRGASVQQIMIEKIPFFVLSAVSCVITFLTQKAGGVIVDIKSIPLMERVGNALFSYAAYMGKMLWPRNLAVFYPFTAVRGIPFRQFVLCALLLVGVSCVVLRFGRSRKYLLVGWFWFVGTLIPVIGLVRFTGSSYADRFTYIPYIGLFIMIAWGVAGFVSRWAYRKVVLGVSMVIVLTVMGIRAHRQVGFWNNSVMLFSHALEVSPYNCLAWYNLGTAYDDLGRHREAIEAYEQAIRIKPDHVDAFYNLGNACSNLGRYQEAIEAFEQAIRIKPDFAHAHSNLGTAYGNLGRYKEAIEALEQAIRIKPDHVDAFYNLGNVYGNLGRFQAAIEAFAQATRIKPDDASAWCNLGNGYGGLGRYQAAIEAYEQAIRIKPDYADAHYNLGNSYGSLGRFQEAIEAFEQAIRIEPDEADAWYNLGNAYSGLGRHQETIEAFKQAIRIRPDYTDAHYNLGCLYLNMSDKGSALEQYEILKTLDAGRAKALFNMINK